MFPLQVDFFIDVFIYFSIDVYTSIYRRIYLCIEVSMYVYIFSLHLISTRCINQMQNKCKINATECTIKIAKPKNAKHWKPIFYLFGPGTSLIFFDNSFWRKMLLRKSSKSLLAA